MRARKAKATVKEQQINISEINTVNESAEAHVCKWYISEQCIFQTVANRKNSDTLKLCRSPTEFHGRCISNLQSNESSKIHLKQKSNLFLSDIVHISSNTHLFCHARKTNILKINVQSMRKANRLIYPNPNIQQSSQLTVNIQINRMKYQRIDEIYYQGKNQSSQRAEKQHNSEVLKKSFHFQHMEKTGKTLSF